jgi:1-phosphofructokinase family hexose kinase
MIACVTPNPALDRTLGIERLTPGEVLRAVWECEVAGGKGLNVARVLHRLGIPSLACGPLGGAVGRRVAELADAEQLTGRWTNVAGETRTCTVLVERNGRSTVINERGPALSDSEWQALEQMIAEVAASATVVTMSGSPPADAASYLPALLRAAMAGGSPVWIDVAGAALTAALDIDGLAIKVNRAEAEAAVGGDGADDAGGVARRLLAAGRARAVVVTDGADGAAYADPAGTWRCYAPPVTVVNPTGSGDAFLAGFVAALARGSRPPDALRHGVAAGAAAATLPTATVDPVAVVRLTDETAPAVFARTLVDGSRGDG